jgi:hypothetical protein
MPYTGMPISMSDNACWPENSIVASLSSDMLEIPEIPIYEDSTRFKKYSNNSEGRDTTLKRNQNDMGSNKRQKTESCYVPSMWYSPATEDDKGMADNQSFKMQFSNVEQGRRRREVAKTPISQQPNSRYLFTVLPLPISMLPDMINTKQNEKWFSAGNKIFHVLQ